MNAAIAIAIRGRFIQIPKFDGIRLYQALDDLDMLAHKLKLELLSSFVLVTNDEVEDAGVDFMEFMMPQHEWFEAEDLLETVFDLRLHLEKHPNAIPNSVLVLPELKALELALELCESNNVAVRLTLEV